MHTPLSHKKAFKHEELLNHSIPDTERQELFDDLARLASDICETPIAAIRLIDSNRQWFKSIVGLDITQVPGNIGFCPICIEQDILVIHDTWADKKLKISPVVNNYPYMRFYAGVPLMTSQGQAIGVLCVIDRVPREISSKQVQGLRRLSRQIVYLLELERYFSTKVDFNIERRYSETNLLRVQRLESIGILASGIAHDLNNIFSPILMAGQLLATQFHDEHSERLLSIVVNNAKRGASLVKQVLSFGRGLQGKQTMVDIRHLISEIEQIVKETFPKSIEFHTKIPSDLWVVFADIAQLHQVLMNLCINARDAMPEGGRLTISAENMVIDEHYAKMKIDATPGSYITITVSDTGSGISPEVIDRIFEPFFTTKEFGLGTGLGLSTVASIVKRYGGFVTVYSEVGKGTEFKVYLKAIQESETQQDSEDTGKLAGNGELILVVDDEAAIREIIKSTLQTHNYRVLTASDGIGALALYVQHIKEISVVLLDIMMPCMDGTTTIRTLQKINPDVKIIATSGLALDDRATELNHMGVKAFLSKPCTTMELLQTVHMLNINQ